MKKLVLLLTVLCTLSVTAQRTSKNYLIQLGGGNGAAWTKTPGANDSIVDLTVAGQTLTAWLAGRTSWVTGDQIWIAAGTYNFTGYYNIGSAPSLATSYPAGIHGGFKGTESSLADRVKGTNMWDFSNETILNGSGSSNGIFGAGGDRNMSVEGLTFSGCVNTAGQAIYQRPNMSIQNCKFTNNACVAVRYYISTASKTATLSNCYFNGNTNTLTAGTEGGCIMANNSSAGGTYTVTNSVFDSNSSVASGSGASAGIKAQGVGTVNISNCIFKNNNATAGNSSAVSLTSATSNLTNCLIYGTSLVTNKNALYVSAGNVTNCTVVGNLGGAAYLSNAITANINITNTVFWGSDSKSGQISAVAGCLGNIINCAYISVSTNYAGTSTNNIDLTTTSTGLFTDPVNNDWTLATGSLLIDMGISTGAPTTDIRGYLRTGTIDIGAYEFGAVAAVNSPTADKKTAVIRNGTMLVSKMDGNIQIFNSCGKQLINRFVRTGESIGLSSGIYIVTMTNSTERITQKIAI